VPDEQVPILEDLLPPLMRDMGVPFVSYNGGGDALLGELHAALKREHVRGLDLLADYNDHTIPLLRPPLPRLVAWFRPDPAVPLLLNDAAKAALAGIGVTSEAQLAIVTGQLLLGCMDPAVRRTLQGEPHQVSTAELVHWVTLQRSSALAAVALPTLIEARYGAEVAALAKRLLDPRRLACLAIPDVEQRVVSPAFAWLPLLQDVPRFAHGELVVVRTIMPMEYPPRDRALLLSRLLAHLLGALPDPRTPAGVRPPLEPRQPLPLGDAPSDKQPWQRADLVLEYAGDHDTRGTTTLVARWVTRADAEARGLNVVDTSTVVQGPAPFEVDDRTTAVIPEQQPQQPPLPEVVKEEEAVV